MRVLLVGGAGFIGDAVAHAMQRHGMQVCVADTARRLDKAGRLLDGIDTRVFDFSAELPSSTLLSGIDALVHLGCTTTPARSMEGMAHDAKSNIVPSIELFEAAAQAGVTRVVFASSGGTVYGSPSALPVTETAPTEPLSAYGVSKLAIEKYLALCPGVTGVSLRVANPYGPFQLRGAAVGVIARYALAIRRGEALEVWGDGSVIRDYIAVDDVAEAFVAVMVDSSLAAGPYNVGSGIGVRVNDIIDTLFRISGRRVAVHHLPARVYDVPAIVLDNRRLRHTTGWTAHIALEDGIAALWQAVVDAPVKPAVRS